MGDYAGNCCYYSLMQKIEIVQSEHVKALCEQANIVMEPNVGALDDIAQHFKVELPERRRLLVLGNKEVVHADPHVRATGWDEQRLPTPHSQHDILINLPKDDWLNEPDLTLGIVRTLAERRANYTRHHTLRASAGAVLGGIAVSFVGDMIVHDRATELIGYGVFGVAATFAAHIATRVVKLPEDVSSFEPPIVLRPL